MNSQLAVALFLSPPLGAVVLDFNPHLTMAEAVSVNPPLEAGGLDQSEILFWRNNYQWLRDRGYQLRPRYSPDWIPSWMGTKKYFRNCEDGVDLAVSPLNLFPQDY